MEVKWNDADTRARIREELDRTFVVEAAAGTGKTTALVQRIVAVVAAGHARMDWIVAVTFTELAAGELKLRVRTQLEEHGERIPALDAGLRSLEAARIGTIHSFCTDLLREYPLEAGVDPEFEVVGESEGSDLLERAFGRWFDETLAHPPEGVRRALRRRNSQGSVGGAKPRLQRAFAEFVDRRDCQAAWTRPSWDRASRIDSLCSTIDRLTESVDAGATSRDGLRQDLARLAEWSRERRSRESASERDYDDLEAEFKSLLGQRIWKRTGRGEYLAPGILRRDVLEQRDALRRDIEEFVRWADADLAACLQQEMREPLAAYESLKKQHGVLDFHDLLLSTLQLLRENESVRRELQRRFTHIFVDEFQDTDPLQVEILFLLASKDSRVPDCRDAGVEPGKLFVVGDPKQAIYRFRRSDIRLYLQAKRFLIAQGAEVLHLTTSFRAVPDLQSLVNIAFETVMTGGLYQAEYVALDRFRPSRPRQPSIIALPVPEPYAPWGKITATAVEASAPNAVAAFVRWLCEDSGWMVDEKGTEVPVRPDHVCLLFRQLQRGFGKDVVGAYLEALSRRGVPHVLAHGRAFHRREEIAAIRIALTAVEWPDDDLAVYATLRGPLFALSDEALFRFRNDVGPLRASRSAEDSARECHPEVVEALEAISDLHRKRNHRSIAETIHALLETTRALAAFGLWSGGDQVLANVDRLMQRARRFEHRGAASFRAFVEWLEESAESRERSESISLQSEMPGVRLMTVHGAKGLEFPVVILCDPSASARSKYPSRYIDVDRNLWSYSLLGCAPLELSEHAAEVCSADDAETQRLTYVAATRARDLLVVPATGDDRLEGWHAVLYDALYPASSTQRQPRPAVGCPPFGSDSVMTRPTDALASPMESVHPGLHRPLRGSHEVVWWDPGILPLSTEALEGVRRQRLLAVADSAACVGNARELEAWRNARSKALQHGSVKSRDVVSVTELAAEFSPSELEGVTIFHTLLAGSARPRGARFGTLVHAVMEIVPLDADTDHVAELVEIHGRLLGATDEECAAAAPAVVAALGHEILQTAAKSDECYREVAVGLLIEGGRIADGIVDLAFRSSVGEWMVVDFKTDLEPGNIPAQYAAQVRLYAKAIEAARGKPARPILMGL